MILTRLVLRNVGVFKGECELDLRPVKRPAKPVILVGGMNGTGKTTILKAIRLCLYGPSIFGVRQSQADDHLKWEIHTSPSLLMPLNSASVTLEFEISHLGVVSRYEVTRSWQVQGKTVTRGIRVRKDGEELHDVGPEQWEAFIRELIPPELSQLYFFDAEKIKELAEGAFEAKVLRESIRQLLGLHLVERLQSDLDILSGRHRRGFSEDRDLQEVHGLSKRLRGIESKIDQNVQAVAETEAKLGSLRSRFEREEQEFHSLGGGYAITQHDWQAKRDELRRKMKGVEEQLQDYCTSFLPFALAPELSERLVHRLDQDAEIRTRKWAEESVNRVVDLLRQTLESSPVWNSKEIGVVMKEKLLSETIGTLRKQIPSGGDGQVIHDIGSQTETSLRAWLSEASTVPVRVQTLSKDYEFNTRELEHVETMIKRAPSDDVLKPAYERMLFLQREMGALEEVLESRKAAQIALRHERDEIARQLTIVQDKIGNLQTLQSKTVMVAKASKVLKEYSDELCRARLQELQEYLVECHRILAQKRDLIQSIEIDPTTFEIKLCDHRGTEIRKDMLSAGEKQIYAISLLWALAKCANREFPFLVDTPLARLDSGHRERFIKNFLPAASPQTILLSTDTEVEIKSFTQIEPLVAKAYRLAHNGAEGSTSVEKGYFWATPEEARA